MSEQLRPAFEAAVIERFKESGYLEVEIRTELLPRAGDGYYDSSIDAYWAFFKRGASSVVVELPERCKPVGHDYVLSQYDASVSREEGYDSGLDDCGAAIKAAGGALKS